MTKGNRKQKRKDKKSLWRFLFKYSFLAGIFSFFVLSAVILYYSIGLPKIDSLFESQKKINTLEIRYSNASLIKKYGNLNENTIIYSEIPYHLIQALVSTEDRRFFEHSGVDIVGILRAFYVNTKAGYIKQGGSTITQQLAKMMFLSSERTIKRKVQEAILALKLERVFSKEQIMTFYLNKAYYGAGKYGIRNASEFYFNKDVSNLDLEESAMLVGLLKAPTKYSPTNNPELARQRASQIIENMVNTGFLDNRMAREIVEDDIYHMYKDSFIKNNQSHYFSDWVKSQIYDFVDMEEEGVYVKTTLDYEMQNLMQETISNFVENNKERLEKSQIALVAMSKEGAILAMSGGINYDKSPFNRSVHAYRQAGSAFKFFVYLTAFQNGINTHDIFIDEPIAVGDWYPENYAGKYYGEVSMKESFAKSLNSVAIQIAEICKIEEVAKTARRLGIMSDIDENDPTIALGSVQVNLLEMVSAYAVLVNNGYPVIPYFIKEIENKNGEVLYKRQSSGLGRVISKDNVKDMREIMFEVINDGTGKNAQIDGFLDDGWEDIGRLFSRKKKYSLGGKTGTSQDYRDAWFIGYADDLVVGVWIGNDDNAPTNNITGGSLPALLWREFVRGALKD